MRLLIVEDELEMLECLRNYFAQSGHRVTSACNVDEAVACLSRSQPDVAFVDMMLPGGHGRRIIQEISKRQMPTRVVVITASDDLELRREMLGYGVCAYLFKPVTIADLNALLNSELLDPAQGSDVLPSDDVPATDQ